MHKKYILRSRVEARGSVAKTTALEAEVERLRGLLKRTEEDLHGKRCVDNGRTAPDIHVMIASSVVGQSARWHRVIEVFFPSSICQPSPEVRSRHTIHIHVSSSANLIETTCCLKTQTNIYIYIYVYIFRKIILHFLGSNFLSANELEIIPQAKYLTKITQ